MRKLILSTLSAVVLSLSSTMPASASVTFDFLVTACSGVACRVPEQFPHVLMSLQLSTLTENGSAQWGGGSSPPIVSDPNFAFSLRDIASFFGTPVIIGPPDFGFALRFSIEPSYNITWSEVAGQLTAVSVNYLDIANEVGFGSGAFGLTGGGIGSDSNIDGCGFGLCMVSGYWQSVPEPGSAILLLSALLGFGMLRRPYRM